MFRKGIVLAFMLSIGMLMVLPAAAKEGAVRVVTQKQTVTLHRLGGPEATGYRLDDDYGGGYLTFDDTLSPEFAKWFAQRVHEGIRGRAEEGGVVFEGLSEGLYLVKDDEDAFSPFVVQLPWDGYHWEVEVDPTDVTLPETGDAVGIALLAMSASAAGITFLGRRKRC